MGTRLQCIITHNFGMHGLPEGKLAALPPELAPHAEQVFQLIDPVFSADQLPGIDDDRKAKVNPLNANFEKKEFQDLWNRINRKAAYTVHFETAELVRKCVATLDRKLNVSPRQFTVQWGEQTETTTAEALQQGEAFQLRLVLSLFRAIFQKPAISRFSETGNFKNRVRFPRFPRLANPGHPTPNRALSAPTAAPKTVKQYIFAGHHHFPLLSNGRFPGSGLN